jgi:hypothetical protein
VVDGRTYDPWDPAYEIAGALAKASQRDHDVFRAFLDVVGVLELPETILARPGMFETVIEHGADWRETEPLGPDRDTLVAMANA